MHDVHGVGRVGDWKLEVAYVRHCVRLECGVELGVVCDDTDECRVCGVELLVGHVRTKIREQVVPIGARE